MQCEICSSEMSNPNNALFSLPSITSDCRSWNPGRSVQICSGCGVMHRVTNPFADFKSIYANYKSYPEPEGRTKKILEFITTKDLKPQLVLDIGSGAGAGLEILSEHFPAASIAGYEPNNGKLLVRPVGKFDLITLFHVLEHVKDLNEMLVYIKSSLAPNGHVLIQVPYTIMWPFDLAIADHMWHFNKSSLAVLLLKNGFKAIYLGNDIIKKELTVLAAIGEMKSDVFIEEKPQFAINWLLNYKSFLDSINERVAVYGTGPAAAWAGNILGDKVVYYLDDDIKRIGTFNGKRVYRPYKEFPIVAPFPNWQLEEIKNRKPELKFL